MSRSFIIALITFLVLIAIAGVLFNTIGAPWLQKKGSAAAVLAVERALQGYGEDHETPPEGSHPEIIHTLIGSNAKMKAYLSEEMAAAIIDGQLNDAYGNPLVFERTGNELRVFSAGRNGIPGDSDDITSAELTGPLGENIASEVEKSAP